MTTHKQISDWFDRGVAANATHMIVVCDTFDHGDYPVYVLPTEDVEEVRKYNNSYDRMTRVMEVYKLSMDRDVQLAEERAFNF